MITQNKIALNIAISVSCMSLIIKRAIPGSGSFDFYSEMASLFLCVITLYAFIFTTQSTGREGERSSR